MKNLWKMKSPREKVTFTGRLAGKLRSNLSQGVWEPVHTLPFGSSSKKFIKVKCTHNWRFVTFYVLFVFPPNFHQQPLEYLHLDIPQAKEPQPKLTTSWTPHKECSLSHVPGWEIWCPPWLPVLLHLPNSVIHRAMDGWFPSSRLPLSPLRRPVSLTEFLWKAGQMCQLLSTAPVLNRRENHIYSFWH